MAKPFIAQMPESFQTQLGRWFKGGQELPEASGRKLLSRAFMRTGADILVLDEPAMDAEAEVRIFEHFRALTEPDGAFDFPPLLDCTYG